MRGDEGGAFESTDGPLDELASAIAERVLEDAIGLGGVQRYIVTAYGGDKVIARLHAPRERRRLRRWPPARRSDRQRAADREGAAHADHAPPRDQRAHARHRRREHLRDADADAAREGRAHLPPRGAALGDGHRRRAARQRPPPPPAREPRGRPEGRGDARGPGDLPAARARPPSTSSPAGRVLPEKTSPALVGLRALVGTHEARAARGAEVRADAGAARDVHRRSSARRSPTRRRRRPSDRSATMPNTFTAPRCPDQRRRRRPVRHAARSAGRRPSSSRAPCSAATSSRARTTAAPTGTSSSTTAASRRSSRRQAPGVRTFDCIVDRVRVRSVGNAALAAPPTIALGAPPAVGHAGVRRPGHARRARASARRSTSALSAGAFKTFILRGAIPPGSRYSILGSMDGHALPGGHALHERPAGRAAGRVLLPVPARPARRRRPDAGPRLRLRRDPRGRRGAGTSEISIADDGEVETSSVANEEVLRQYRVPLALLSPATLRVDAGRRGPRRAKARAR